MGKRSLNEVLTAESSIQQILRKNNGRHPYPVPSEHTNWIEEMRSWRETCSLSDLSHHQKDLYVTGPECLEPFKDLGVNDFTDFQPDKAKQFVACNEDGYLIGDAILFYLEENQLKLTGTPITPNWVEYNIEQGPYNVEVEVDDRYYDKDEPHETFRFQLQGPNAVPLLENAADEPITDIPFFNIGEINIAGYELKALRHAMVADSGFEFWGPWEHRNAVRDAIIETGEDYGLRRLGEKSYKAQTIEKGWIPRPLPAIFGDEHEDYREWLTEDSYEAISTLGGSYDPDDIEDYYLDPIELGYGRFIDWDREFVGKEALKTWAKSPRRQKVTLIWNPKDILSVFQSLFSSGTTEKWVDLSEPYWAVYHYDDILVNGSNVGVSKYFGYSPNARNVLSLALVEPEYAEPGTEVNIRWGEPQTPSPNPKVEDHEQTSIKARVEDVPYPIQKKTSKAVAKER